MTNYILSFCDEFNYPLEAKQCLQAAYVQLKKNPTALVMFQKYIDGYNNDELTDYNPILPLLDKAAELSGTHRYIIHLLFYICLTKHTKYLYEKRKLSYGIYYDSMSDLKWKLLECHKMYGVWGSFVASWFPGFFQLTRFALGRLQFEIIEFQRSYEKRAYRLQPKDIVVNIHIPSSGLLLHEDCLLSYCKATDFFKEYFVGKPTTFVCNSWLLYPPNKDLLPKESNIIQFMDDFDIIDSSIDEKDEDLWRIFYREYNGHPEELPCKTSLQRAYIEWLVKGNHIGNGTGVFMFEGKRIL